VVVDGAAREVGEFGSWGSDAGLPIDVWIADDCIGIRDIEVVANQGDAEW
jgi:hypothetical protein